MSLFCGVAALAALTIPAQALERHERSRTVFGITLGGGSARIGLDLDDTGRIRTEGQGGFGFGFRLGRMVRPDLALTFEGSGWSRRYDNLFGQDLIPTTVTTTVIGGALTLYPAESGFYVRGGLGLGTGRVELLFPGFSADKAKYGFGLLGGVGYEFRLGETFAVGPTVDFGATRLGTTKLGATSVDFDLSYINFGVSANWYPGKNRRSGRP